MSNLSQNRIGPDGVASTPTSYEVMHITLQSNSVMNNKKNYLYDITNMVADFSIKESLSSPGLAIIIRIGDTINMMEELKLTGNEKITIGVRRKEPIAGSATSSVSKHIEIECHISEITSYTRVKSNSAAYTLLCISEHMYLNHLKSLKTAFSGTPVEIIKKVCKSQLNKDVVTNDGSKNIISGVFPTLRVLSGVSWILRHAFDDGTPYFFYQTFYNSGELNCLSYKHLLGQDIYDEYTFAPFINPSIKFESREGYEVERTMIRDIVSDYGQGKYVAASKGAYASSTHTIDIAEKSYNKSVYQYKPDQKLNSHGVLSTTEQAKIGDNILTDYFDSKNYFISLNSKAFENGRNYMSPAPTDLPKAMAHLENFNHQTHQIQIAGDFDMRVGNKIKVTIKKPQEEVSGSGVDLLHSGIYLVTEITHAFGKGYYQTLTIQKDSGEVNLNAS